MIDIQVMNSNNIITLSSEGKLPIKSSQGFMFYSPNELLCASYGACAGRHIVLYASQNKINLDGFHSFKVDMDNDEIIMYLTYPKEFDPKELVYLLENCEISKKLSIPIKVVAVQQDTPTEEVVKSKQKKPCCGGTV